MAARLAISDSQRIVRALEVLEATGRSLADWQRVPGQPIIEPSAARRLVVLPEREELYRRCDARFGAMMAQGAVEEARAVAALELDPKLPGMRALGLAQLMQLAVGSLGREQAIEAAQAETRQYVKRQITWLKRHMVAWKHVNLIDMQSISLTII